MKLLNEEKTSKIVKTNGVRPNRLVAFGNMVSYAFRMLFNRRPVDVCGIFYAECERKGDELHVLMRGFNAGNPLYIETVLVQMSGSHADTMRKRGISPRHVVGSTMTTGEEMPEEIKALLRGMFGDDLKFAEPEKPTKH